MKHFFVFIFLINCCFISNFCDELVGVAVLVNHGDTIPENFYPKDPYQNVPMWPKNSLGQLSNLGKEQTYVIGQWLRRRYMTKLPLVTLHYNASQTYTYSEDRDESLMSGECLMAGLYPPVGTEIWNEEILWRPTPVHTSPLFLDHTIGRGFYCPKFDTEIEKVKHGRYLRNLNKVDQNLLQFVSEKTGENIVNIHQLPKIFNILTVEENHGLVLPDWTKSIYPKILGQVVLETSVLRTKNPLLAQLSIGPFFHKLISQFRAIITKDPNLGNTSGDLRKFKIYISNDTLIYDTLNVLKIADVGIVNYASALIFELWKNNDVNDDQRDFSVKVLFKKSPEREESAKPIKVGHCKSYKCNFGKFEGMLANYALNFTQWNRTCHGGVID